MRWWSKFLLRSFLSLPLRLCAFASLSSSARKRRAFSLLEILIALSLIGVLLGALLYSQKEIGKARKEVALIREQVYARSRLQLRLAPLFKSLTDISLNLQGLAIKHAAPEEDEKSALSLLWQEGSELILTTWEDEFSKQPTQEVVFTGIKEKVSFLFFNPETSTWTKELPKEESEEKNPTLVKFEINNVPFIFSLA